MNLKSYITDLIETELQDSDHFLVGIDANEAGTDLKFYIDGKQGVDIRVCSRLSRKISRTLDEEEYDDVPFRFEISSPGAERPLVDIRQYHQHIGRDLLLELSDEEEVEGELLRVLDDAIELSVQVSKNKKEDRVIDRENIKKSTVKISFKSKK